MKDSEEFTSIWRDYSRAFRPPDLMLGVMSTTHSDGGKEWRRLLAACEPTQSAPAKPVSDKPEQPFKLLPLRPAP